VLHFLTCRIEPVGLGLSEKEIPYRISHLAKPTLAILSIFDNWGATETVISPWEGTEDELLKLVNKPKKLILYALEHMDTEHTDFIDGLISNSDEDDEICINGRAVQIDW